MKVNLCTNQLKSVSHIHLYVDVFDFCHELINDVTTFSHTEIVKFSNSNPLQPCCHTEISYRRPFYFCSH